jgi:hypothetical protein
MKTRLMVGAYWVVLLSGAAMACGQNRLDIVLEGPWILYQDTQFLDGTKKVPVLIAMAPGVVDDTQLWGHHTPTFSAGDGTLFDPGVYCIGFDKNCDPHRPKISLSTDGYPGSQLLGVAVPAGWAWSTTAFRSDGTYLILPMPDSYSNDGVYPMRFSKTFHPTNDNEYVYKTVSIGVELHYDTGPKTLYLTPCQKRDPAPNTTHCSQATTSLVNTGTLSITMKAPDNDNACDPHVRYAYPHMLHLLDPSSISKQKNFNQPFGYIDPARGIDKSGNPNYSDPPLPSDDNCFKNDYQQLPDGQQPAMQAMLANQVLDTQLNTILGELDHLHLTVDQKTKYPLLSDEIQVEFSRLDLTFPRMSQLLRIKQLLRLTASEAQELSQTLDSKATDLRTLAKSAKDLSEALPTKDGKDCRAPIMLVQ